MRDGPYELVLRERTPEGKLLREEDVKGETVVHGDKGSEFIVCINIFRDENRTSGLHASSVWVCMLMAKTCNTGIASIYRISFLWKSIM